MAKRRTKKPVKKRAPAKKKVKKAVKKKERGLLDGFCIANDKDVIRVSSDGHFFGAPEEIGQVMQFDTKADAEAFLREKYPEDFSITAKPLTDYFQENYGFTSNDELVVDVINILSKATTRKEAIAGHRAGLADDVRQANFSLKNCKKEYATAIRTTHSEFKADLSTIGKELKEAERRLVAFRRLYK